MLINRTTSRIVNNKLVNISLTLDNKINDYTNNKISEQKYKDELLNLNSSLKDLYNKYKYLIESVPSLKSEYNFLISKISRYYYFSHRLSPAKATDISDEC